MHKGLLSDFPKMYNLGFSTNDSMSTGCLCGNLALNSSSVRKLHEISYRNETIKLT